MIIFHWYRIYRTFAWFFRVHFSSGYAVLSAFLENLFECFMWHHLKHSLTNFWIEFMNKISSICIFFSSFWMILHKMFHKMDCIYWCLLTYFLLFMNILQNASGGKDSNALETKTKAISKLYSRCFFVDFNLFGSNFGHWHRCLVFLFLCLFSFTVTCNIDSSNSK